MVTCFIAEIRKGRIPDAGLECLVIIWHYLYKYYWHKDSVIPSVSTTGTRTVWSHQQVLLAQGQCDPTYKYYWHKDSVIPPTSTTGTRTVWSHGTLDMDFSSPLWKWPAFEQPLTHDPDDSPPSSTVIKTELFLKSLPVFPSRCGQNVVTRIPYVRKFTLNHSVVRLCSLFQILAHTKYLVQLHKFWYGSRE
jgi:hypothetical protein